MNKRKRRQLKICLFDTTCEIEVLIPIHWVLIELRRSNNIRVLNHLPLQVGQWTVFCTLPSLGACNAMFFLIQHHTATVNRMTKNIDIPTDSELVWSSVYAWNTMQCRFLPELSWLRWDEPGTGNQKYSTQHIIDRAIYQCENLNIHENFWKVPSLRTGHRTYSMVHPCITEIVEADMGNLV